MGPYSDGLPFGAGRVFEGASLCIALLSLVRSGRIGVSGPKTMCTTDALHNKNGVGK